MTVNRLRPPAGPTTGGTPSRGGGRTGEVLVQEVGPALAAGAGGSQVGAAPEGAEDRAGQAERDRTAVTAGGAQVVAEQVGGVQNLRAAQVGGTAGARGPGRRRWTGRPGRTRRGGGSGHGRRCREPAAGRSPGGRGCRWIRSRECAPCRHDGGARGSVTMRRWSGIPMRTGRQPVDPCRWRRPASCCARAERGRAGRGRGRAGRRSGRSRR